jgi:hypothetical protein
MKNKMLLAILLSIVAVLSMWRASQGRPGWAEMSVIWSIGALVTWIQFARTKGRQRAK